MKSLVAIFAALAPGLLFATPGQGACYTNTIQSFSFDPPTRTIAAGDTVVWVNLDAVSHTVTGDAEEEPICGSGFLFQGTNWLALTVQSNRLANGAVETFCGRPAGDSVFIRIISAR